MNFMLRRATTAMALFGISLGCSKKKDDEANKNEVPIVVYALNLGSTMSMQKAAANLLAAGGPEDPDYTGGEYDGMGVFTSDAVVEEFKIKITGVTFASATTSANELKLDEDKSELDISLGVNEPISVSGVLPKGKWDRVTVNTKPEFKLKAYAYMDKDNNGTIDTTVYTTADEIKVATGRLTATELAAAGYGTHQYKFMYTYCSETPTGSTDSVCGTGVVFPEPFNTEEPPVDEEGNVREDGTYTVSLLIDSTKVVTAWTGESGNVQINGSEPTTTVLGDPARLPLATAGFPLSDTCSDTKNANGFNTCDFFPYGKPAFKMSYLPAFAFLGTESLTSQVYAVSTEAGVWNHYNSGFVEVVLSSGEPQFGRIFTATDWRLDQSVTPWKVLSSAAPLLGSVSRLFEKDGDSYKFYMDGSSTNADGEDDGGLYYNNEKDMAGAVASNFKLLELNGTGTMTVSDGPRCKGEYDTCLGDRTYYVKRIK